MMMMIMMMMMMMMMMIIIIIIIIIIIMCPFAAVLRTSALCHVIRFSQKQNYFPIGVQNVQNCLHYAQQTSFSECLEMNFSA